MTTLPEGQAIIYCEGAYSSPNGKTAHGLIRRSERYRVLSVVDSHHAGEDAGAVLDNMPNNIPIYRDVKQAMMASRKEKSSLLNPFLPCRQDQEKSMGLMKLTSTVSNESDQLEILRQNS